MTESGTFAPNPIGYNQRIAVPDALVPWRADYPSYNPPEFNDEEFLTKGIEQGWADQHDAHLVDFSNRPSFEGAVLLDPTTGRPLNPRGRQGLAGRGELGKWGVNNAADPVVIAIDPSGIKQILLIQRANGQWAFPGGMVDPGELVTATARRELREEANIELNDIVARIITKGYVNDPRNTDNAWMETVASLFVLDFTPAPKHGDDAKDAKWFNIPSDLKSLEGQTGKLYASHGDILTLALAQI